MKPVIKSEYDIQAETFLRKCGITFETHYLGHYPAKWDLKGGRGRAHWAITLSRSQKKPLTLTFGAPLVNSYQDSQRKNPGQIGTPLDYARQKKVSPSPYSVLACVTKCDPGTFANFCADYGYSTDSRKAFEMYLETQKEWGDIERFFSPEEQEKLAEIN